MIDARTVKHIAKLSRLKLTAEEEIAAAQDLSRILAYMEKLEELDTTGIEPTFPMAFDAESLRQDRAEASMPNSEILANAPDSEDGAYKVPNVVEE